MAKLSQLVAVRKGVLAQYGRGRDAAYHTAQKEALFNGLSRTYQPRADGGETFPPESTRVQQTVDSLLKGMAATMSRMWDVTATVDEGNTRARADVIVGGVPVLVGVTAVTLIFLEKQLADVRSMIAKMPLLDPAQHWEYDQAVDHWVAAEQVTARPRKVPRNHVKAPATDKHPAQVDVYFENEVVGDWTLRNFSGAMPAARQRVLLERVEALLEAVKFAREAANSVEVADQVVGKPVFDWLFRD